VIYDVRASTPPESPVSLSEMKAWLRVSHDAEDDAIARLLVAACEAIESDTWLSLSEREWTYTAIVPSAMHTGMVSLWRRGVSAIESVEIIDRTGDTVLVDGDDYWKTATGSVLFASPRFLDAGSSLRVVFTAGYATAADVPEAIRTAIKRAVALNYDYRTDVVIGTSLFKLPAGEFDMLHSYRAFTI